MTGHACGLVILGALMVVIDGRHRFFSAGSHPRKPAAALAQDLSEWLDAKRAARSAAADVMLRVAVPRMGLLG